MAILVHFKRNNFGYVENSELDTMIENQAIDAFKRASGWVQIGKDPIRTTGVKQPYKGPERRESLMPSIAHSAEGSIVSSIKTYRSALMKLNATYEIGGEFLYVKVIGEFHPTTARDIFFEWTEMARSLNLNRVLCDIRLVEGMDADSLSAMTRFETSKFITRSLPKGLKLAVLETPMRISKDGIGETVMRSRGANVKVTTRLQDALEWLDLTR